MEWIKGIPGMEVGMKFTIKMSWASVVQVKEEETDLRCNERRNQEEFVVWEMLKVPSDG